MAQDEWSWRAGYAAAYTAKMAGKRTPPAPQGADGLSYISGTVEGAAAAEPELDPKEVLADPFEEELHPDPEHLAEIVIRRLINAGL